MDQDAKDRIIRDMDVESKGFESELERVLIEDNNQASISKKQKQAIRSRMTTSKSREGGKIERYGKTYINVREDEYRRVTSKEDVYRDRFGNVWLRDENGRFKKRIE